MNIEFFFNRHFIRTRGSNEYGLLINLEAVHHFTLPNHERTNTHNRDNWLYDLEGQDESSTPSQTPPAPEYLTSPLSDVPFSSSSTSAPPMGKHNVELNALRTELTTLCRVFHDYTDAMAEKMEHIYQEI